MGDLVDIRVPQGAFSIGTFDGKERFLRFDLNAFAELENLYGDMAKLDDILAGGRMTDIRRILWAGLIWDEAVLDEVTGEPIKYNVTIHQVGTWVTPANMRSMLEGITNAIKSSMPEGEDLEKAMEEAQKTQTEIAGQAGWKPPSDRAAEMKEAGTVPNEGSGTGDFTTTVD